jgi:hypothetical protein
MKKFILVFSAALLVALPTRGQGTIVVPGQMNFANLVTGSGIDAPVTDQAGSRIGPGFTAQLYGGPAGLPMAPLFPTTTFRSGNKLGYIVPLLVEVPDVSPGQEGVFRVRVYNGPDWDSSLIRGESKVLHLEPGGWTRPPMDLYGLEAFQVLPVPEPSIIALGCVGLVFLWIRKSRGSVAQIFPARISE